ncbi:hypothetical protein CR513_15024, partial [Mucuna pruriens]
MTIRVSKEQGIYYLQHTKIGNNTNKEELPVAPQVATNILDIHRLGYLRQCFHIYLQKSLSSPLSVIFVSFQSIIVQHFSPNNNKSLKPFDLIHSYVWEPASNSISGTKWFVSFIDDCTRVNEYFL